MAADAFSCSAFSSCRVSLIRSVFVLMSVQRKCEISSSEVVFFFKVSFSPSFVQHIGYWTSLNGNTKFLKSCEWWKQQWNSVCVVWEQLCKQPSNVDWLAKDLFLEI